MAIILFAVGLAVSFRASDLHHRPVWCGRSRCPMPVVAAAPVENEFSRKVAVAALGRKAMRREITASRAECDALAARFDLEGLGTLRANVSLAVVNPRCNRVRVYGKLQAADVVMRGPLGSATTLQLSDVAFETFFVDEEQLTVGGAYDSGAEESYDEPLEDGQIDMGELVAQFMYLYLSEQENMRLREFSEEYQAGDIVYDTDPDPE